MVRGRTAAGKRELYELGHWSEAYMAQRASEITDFHCLRCKHDFHGISMYEHFATCSPIFFKSLNKHKERRFGHVKQTGRSGFDPYGISSELQDEVLQAESKEDSGVMLEDPRSENVREDPQSYFEILRGFRNGQKDKEAP